MLQKNNNINITVNNHKCIGTKYASRTYVLTLSISAKQSSAHFNPKWTVALLLYASAKKGSILMTSDRAASASLYCSSATYCFVDSMSSWTKVWECLVQHKNINCSAGFDSSSVSTPEDAPVRAEEWVTFDKNMINIDQNCIIEGQIKSNQIQSNHTKSEWNTKILDDIFDIIS